MATYLENLTTARNNVAAALASITTNPKPSYSIDGESYSWGEYLGQLTTALADLESKIAAADPAEVTHYGIN